MRNMSKFLWLLFTCSMDSANSDHVEWLIIIGIRWSSCNCKKERSNFTLYTHIFDLLLGLVKIVFHCLLREG